MRTRLSHMDHRHGGFGAGGGARGCGRVQEAVGRGRKPAGQGREKTPVAEQGVKGARGWAGGERLRPRWPGSKRRGPGPRLGENERPRSRLCCKMG